MHIDADARLAAAAGGAARYFGDAAGLENDAIAHLQAAIVSACLQAFEHLADVHSHLDVTFTRLADRIEVALSHEGEGIPALGLDSTVGFVVPRDTGAAESAGSPAAIEGVDRVQYETHGGVAVTRLTKYVVQRNARC
jgi:hypothetical protein